MYGCSVGGAWVAVIYIPRPKRSIFKPVRYFKSAAGCCVKCLSIGCARHPAKYVQVFRISGAPVSVWCCYCTPASHVLKRGPAAPTARPQQPRVQPEWADRAVNRWLPEFVFKHSLVCTLSFSIFIYLSFLESHTWQPQELIARQMRGGNNGKGVVGCLGLSDLDALLVNSIFSHVSAAFLLMRHQ